jgi:hypothetical protein
MWWSTAIGSSQVNDQAGRRLPHAVEGLDPGGYEPGQLVEVLAVLGYQDFDKGLEFWG